MKYYIKTFGCQMNYSDSERIAAALENIGYKKASKKEDADLVIFNTCSVRQSAEDRVVGQIRHVAKNKKTKIALTGCMAHYPEKRIKQWMKRVDYFFPINDLPVFTKECLIPTEGEKAVSRPQIEQDYLRIKPSYATKFTAYVPIMTGCNNFCSYCIVPYARGRERSRPMADVLAEVKTLAANGYKEIYLVGQNVNSYKPDFASLLKKVNNIPGDFWLRFLTSHPKDMSDKLIKTMPKLDKLCEYLHLPFQSGDDEILKLMNRNYNAKQYKTLLNKIKKYNPDYVFSTDVIVGFPGETKEQFLNSAKFLKQGDFDMAYISQYSPRPWTAASKMKDDVSRAEKERRGNVLVDILKENIEKHNKKLLGKKLQVLVFSRKKDYYIGITRTMKKVRFKSGKNVIGEFVNVKIVKALDWGLEGKIV